MVGAGLSRVHLSRKSVARFAVKKPLTAEIGRKAAEIAEKGGGD
jgi:hypothetical protein